MSRLPMEDVTRDELYERSNAIVERTHVKGQHDAEAGIFAQARFKQENPDIAEDPELYSRACDLYRQKLVEDINSGKPIYEQRTPAQRMEEIAETLRPEVEAKRRPAQEPSRSAVVAEMQRARQVGRGHEETREDIDKRFLHAQRIEADRRARAGVATVATVAAAKRK